MISGIFRHGDQFFRFYDDGLFRDCLIRVSAAEEQGLGTQISHWFRREQETPGVFRGQYSIAGGRIRFQTPGHFGDGKRVVVYEGIYRKNSLILDSLDHNTGHGAKGVEYERISCEQSSARMGGKKA